LRKLMAIIAAALMLTAFAAPVQAKRAEFTITSYSTLFDNSTGVVTFTIRFSVKPNFTTADEFNRQADSFQILVPDETVIRGEEIHCSGDIPVRRVSPEVTDACSGGWGRVVTSVPYALHGKKLTFEVAHGFLSFHESTIPYTIESYVYGAQTFHAENTIDLCNAGCPMLPN
jgi:hypothetical protein